MKLIPSLLMSLLAGISGAAAQETGLQEAPYGPARISGMLVDTRISESSGLAASNHEPNRYWTHNDGGNKPRIFAIDSGGARHGFVQIESATNQDWEDLATFVLDGRKYLAIGDVGDNGGIRKSVVIYVIEEPEHPRGQSIEPAHTFRFKLEGGPRDIESLAFDPDERAFYLLSKRGFPAHLYRIAWPEPGQAIEQQANRVGTVTAIPQPTIEDQKVDPKGWRYRAQPTAMDFSHGGRSAVVLTYKHAYLFPRHEGETWATALARNPQLIKLPTLPQGEAIAFDKLGNILISTEKWPAPLLLIKPES